MTPLYYWIAICLLSVGTFASDIIPIPAGSFGINQLLLAGISLIFTIRFFLVRGHGQVMSATTIAALLLILWGVLSVGWSDQPAGTAAKAATFMTIYFSMGYFALRLDSTDILRGIAYGALIALLMSMAAIIVMPGLAATTPFHDGAWRGIYSQKNVLGRACVLCICYLLLLRPFVPARERWLGLGGILLAFVMLIMSRSATAIGVAVFFIAILPAMAAFIRLPVGARGVLLVGLIAIITVALTNISTILDLVTQSLGRSDNLTGRVPLWDYVIRDAWNRPLFGYGLGAYYTEAREAGFMAALHWVPEQSHNGLLDLTIELGLVGLALGIVAFAALCMDVIKAPRTTGLPTLHLGIGTIFILILMNVTESNFFRPSNLLWLVFLICGMKFSLEAKARLARRRPRLLPAPDRPREGTGGGRPEDRAGELFSDTLFKP